MSEEPLANWETIANEQGITGARNSAAIAAPEEAATAPVIVEEELQWQPRGPRRIQRSLEFKRPHESRELATTNLASFESKFPETPNIRGIPVHNDTICAADFPALAIRLNNYIHLQNISGDDKYNRVEGQLKRCIAKRILTHKGALKSRERSIKSDKKHLGYIIQLYDMYKNFEQRYAAGTFNELSKIEWIATSSRFGPDGYFKVTYTHIPPSAPVLSASTATTNGNAWGGKRTTRKMRKSKRKQTRRRR